MYWLRRIPTETRIVVIVVSLAFLQAILLSVFGLQAIERERRQVEEGLTRRALVFAENYLAAPARAELRRRADEVFLGAFDEKNADWKQGGAGGGLFRDAFLLQDDGAIATPDGRPLFLPPHRRDPSTAILEADELRRQFVQDTELGERQKMAMATLDFAQRHPFAVDEDGDNRSLLFALTRLHGEQPADLATLLEVRWIGVLNRAAGQDVSWFLREVRKSAGDADAYAAAARAQDRGPGRSLIEMLQSSDRIRAEDLPAGRYTLLNVRHMEPGPAGGTEVRHFYVRRVRQGAPIQTLVVDGDRLQGLFAETARAARDEGIKRGIINPRIRLRGRDESGEEALHAIPDLPGYVAAATVSEEALRDQAAERARFYRYIIAFSVLGILAGGFLTARVVMREIKLAKLKSGFVSNISHELKTPLTSIQMFVEMLREGKVQDAAERNQCLDVISQESGRLAALIQRVLDFGKLEARRRTYRWRTASIAGLVQREAERFLTLTGLERERLTVRVEDDLPPVQHDPEALSEVLSNLFGNAYKYSPADDRHIEIRVQELRGRVVLYVEDNGPGVAAGERHKIFEQFYRAHDLLTNEVEGTGLGLTIARSLVRAHGGRIRVEDRPGGGSRFVVELPAAGGARRSVRRP